MAANDAIVEAGERLAAALGRLNRLADAGPARDRLWTELLGITTRSTSYAIPRGSSRPVRITAEHAADELIAAWEWLEGHEDEARALNGPKLYMALRSAATRSYRGSARRALADRLGGLTHVPSGMWVEVAGDELLARIA